jgi:hypothetical protein
MADLKSTGHGDWEKLQVIKFDTDGQFQIRNKDGNNIVCKSLSEDKGIEARSDGDNRMGFWQFFEKDDGVVIFNPLVKRFLGPMGSDGKAGCLAI